ncbi:MAG: LuxR C-terminal-related transcriptional regulator, partial [Chloroflexota bacterium]
VLEDQPDLEVVGAVGSAEEALASTARPDVLLLDLELPGLDGVAALPRLVAALPTARVLVFTAYATDARIFGALSAGAVGYLLKGTPATELVRAIRDVAAGGSSLGPMVAARVVAAVNVPQRSATVLSPREREVLGLLAEGLLTKQIARSLGITERTVKFHVASLFAKLGAGNRAQAVALAAQRHLL